MMPKGRFISHKQEVLMVWKGESLGIGKPLKAGMYGTRYSTPKYKKLLDAGVGFTNEFSDAYHFPGHYDKPRDVQKKMLDFQLRHHRGYNLSTMRVGKSAPVPWQIDIERRYNGKKRFLVLAPLSTLEDTWKSEFFGILTGTPVFYSTHATQGVAKVKRCLKRDRHPVVVLNFDKLWRCIDELEAWNPDCVFVDEASDFNDETTNKYKALARLMSSPERSLLGLTGTPRPNKPTDCWAMARLINPDTPKRKGQLKAMTMVKVGYGPYGKWEEKEEAAEIVAGLMQPSVRFTVDDVGDIPEHEGVDADVPMTPKQEKMFQEMKYQLITEDNGRVITAAHAGAKLWKLLQISSGMCYDADGNAVMIGAQQKVEEAKRIIREADGKAVLMVPFTSVQHYLVNELKGLYRIGLINGKTPTRQRGKLLRQFQSDGLDLLICHPRTTRYGLKMHAASVIIWFGPVYSALDFEQGSARIRAPGTGKTFYVKLAASKLERDIFNLMEARMAGQQRTLSLGQELKQIYQTMFSGEAT